MSGFQGKGLVNTWTGSDAPRGKLTSPAFTIDRDYLNFLIGGGNHPDETCINLKVDGQVVRTATGKSTDAMEWAGWDVRDLQGKTARIEIVDQHSDDWGHIDIDQIELNDSSRTPRVPAGSPPRSRHDDPGALRAAGEADRGIASMPPGPRPSRSSAATCPQRNHLAPNSRVPWSGCIEARSGPGGER